MAHNNIEIEVKFPLYNKDEILAELAKAAEPLKESRQIDTYYNAPHRDFFATHIVDEWLRVREEDGKASINYKLWQPRQAEKSTYCNEYESKITSPSDVKAILAALDFKQLIVVDKTRKSFQFEDSEISVDVIEGLGSFIEAEFNGAGEDKEAVARNLVDQLQRLGAKTGEQDYRGYPYRLLEKAGFFKQKS